MNVNCSYEKWPDWEDAFEDDDDDEAERCTALQGGSLTNENTNSNAITAAIPMHLLLLLRAGSVHVFFVRAVVMKTWEQLFGRVAS